MQNNEIVETIDEEDKNEEILKNFDFIAKIFEYCRTSEEKIIVKARMNQASPEHAYYFMGYSLNFLDRTLSIDLKAAAGEDNRNYGLYYSSVMWFVFMQLAKKQVKEINDKLKMKR